MSYSNLTFMDIIYKIYIYIIHIYTHILYIIQIKAKCMYVHCTLLCLTVCMLRLGKRLDELAQLFSEVVGEV